MNRLAQTICILGVAAAGFAPVLLYAKQDGRSPSVESADVANPKAETIAVWTPPSRPQPHASFAAPIEETEFAAPAPPEAVYAEALPAVYEGDYDDPIWAVVARGAKLHTDPDISSPTTWYYGVGAKLHVLGFRQGWYHVVDPETSRRGFIYARYYLEALRSPDATLPVVAKTASPTQTALAEPAPAEAQKQAVRHASRDVPMLLAPTPAVEPAARASRTVRQPRGVAALLDKAIRR